MAILNVVPEWPILSKTCQGFLRKKLIPGMVVRKLSKTTSVMSIKVYLHRSMKYRERKFSPSWRTGSECRIFVRFNPKYLQSCSCWGWGMAVLNHLCGCFRPPCVCFPVETHANSDKVARWRAAICVPQIILRSCQSWGPFNRGYTEWSRAWHSNGEPGW